MGERWLKQGYKSFLSPRLWKWLISYYRGGWRNLPLFKLCCSAFCAADHYKLNTFRGKCYKWGYFTQIGCPDFNSIGKSSEIAFTKPTKFGHNIRLMWCSRFIDWKHPELPIKLAMLLKQNNCCNFHIDMYGDGVMKNSMEELVKDNSLDDVVSLCGNVPNKQVRLAMKEHDIFLFTSDKREGWGAVANESMSEGCLLIGSDEIGAIPFLINDGVNGLVYKSKSVNSLYEKVVWVIEHPNESRVIAENGHKTIHEVWSPQKAALALLQLKDELSKEIPSSIKEGPCSKA